MVKGLVFIGILGMAVLVGCSKEPISEVVVNEDIVMYTQIKDELINNIYLSYNAETKEDYDLAYENIAKYMTNACAKSFKSQLGEYIEDSTSRGKIEVSDYGLSDWQDDNDSLIYIVVSIIGKGEIHLEFKFNSNNLIYTYEVW